MNEPPNPLVRLANSNYTTLLTMRKLFLTLFYLTSLGFALWSLYNIIFIGPKLYYYIGILVGAMFGFFVADSNVYQQRLESLFHELQEADLDISIERVQYTEYEITKEEDQ